MAIERDMLAQRSPDQHQEIVRRLDEIEHSVNEIKTPLSFADQLYVLRDHVSMVRRRLVADPATAPRTSSRGGEGLGTH